MPALTREQQYFIVRRLAVFESYPEILLAFSLFFPGVPVSDAAVSDCDPSRGRLQDAFLLDAFHARRTEFLDSKHAAPTSDRRVRLAELHRVAETYKSTNRLGDFRATLAQIATEMAAEAEEKRRSGEGDADQLDPIRSVIWEVVPVKPNGGSGDDGP